MCLHTAVYAGGYRIGETKSLNNSVDYEKVFFERNGATVVPEPSTVVLMASGLLAMGGLLRRRKRAA
jgi:hypothetical protein